MRNFTIVDTLGILKACIVLAPLMFAPGYVIGWACDLFEFRHRRLVLRFVLAVPLTIAICPMLTYLLARFLEPGLWVFYIGVSAACVLFLGRDAGGVKLQSVSKYIWIALGLTVLWASVALGSLIDLQIGNQLYPPIEAYDHSVRTALIAAVARHIPPSNPFFANAAAPLRYHYLWLLFCSLPMKVFHFSPRYAVYSGVVWCGVGLICVIALGLKFLLRVQTGIEQKALLGVGLLCVTGLDILPILYLRTTLGSWAADMEWWNEVQITSWAGSLLWAPHHVAALIACFVAFLLLRHAADTSGSRAAIPVIVSGMAFASAAGLSVYVTFAFVVAIFLWLLALVARKVWKEAAMFGGAGVGALIWGLPYLTSLGNSGSGAAFAEFALRPFPLGLHFAQQIGINFTSQTALTIANAIFLPLNYALELGFFLAVGVVRLCQLFHGRVEASSDEQAAWTLVMASFLIGTFLRSSTTGSNDLGWRCFLPAQLILLLWGAVIVHDWLNGVVSRLSPRPVTHWALATLLILGLMGTAYQMFMLRVFPVLYDYRDISGLSWMDPDGQFGKRTYALRAVYELLDAQLPASAVLQSSPVTADPIPHMLYSGHDSAAATPWGDPECGTAFGGDPDLCALRVQNLIGLFELPDGGNLDTTCREYGIDAVIVVDSDRVWKEPSSWIWSRHPVVTNDYVRAFRCGTSAASVHR